MLWDELINSYWRDWRTGDRSKDRDRLEDQEWLKQWLKQHSLNAGPPLNAEEMTQLKQLRSLLGEAVQQLVQGQSPEQPLLDKLNEYMSKGPVIRQLVPSPEGDAKLVQLPQGSGCVQVMAEIAASFAAALTEKESGRFRICENPDCLWVYYDDTRNRSKRYCDDKMCGNLMKVRRFRARKKAEEGDREM